MQPVIMQRLPTPQQYVRTTQKPQMRLSKQNELIATEFECCNFALIELIRRNITITRVVLGNSKPEITIMDSAQARALANTIHRESDRRYLRVATIHECHIIWETTDDAR